MDSITSSSSAVALSPVEDHYAHYDMCNIMSVVVYSRRFFWRYVYVSVENDHALVLILGLLFFRWWRFLGVSNVRGKLEHDKNSV